MPGRVLIVEDEVDLAATMEYSLTREGYQVSVAHTGAAALAAALAEPGPDVIVLDLMLPDLPGTEVCRRLREHDRTRDLPIVMCTAKDTEIDRVVGFEVGADDYVVKPFSVRELGLRVRALCGAASGSTPRPSRCGSAGCASIATPTGCGSTTRRSC
jgi:two-component system phosphate regulon response regulator PhoB